MASKSMTLKEIRSVVTSFISKHRDSLYIGRGKKVDDNFIRELDNAATNADFIEIATDVQFNFGGHYYLFCSNRSSCGLTMQLWLPTKVANSGFIGHIEKANAYETIEQDSSWYNITWIRWSAFVNMFETYCVTKTPTKTTSKKTTTKKTNPKKIAPKESDEQKISDIVTVKDRIAFLATEDDSINHAYEFGGVNIDLCWEERDECGKDNQIDHVINAFKCAIREYNSIISDLTNAKALGATHVIDSDYTSPKNFKF